MSLKTRRTNKMDQWVITNEGLGIVEGDGEGGITFGPPDHHGTFNIGGDGLV